MIDHHSPKEILQRYENARNVINQAKVRAGENASVEELKNVEWFEHIIDTAASYIGPEGMNFTQAKGMFRALIESAPDGPTDVTAAVDDFVESVMENARSRSELP